MTRLRENPAAAVGLIAGFTLIVLAVDGLVLMPALEQTGDSISDQVKLALWLVVSASPAVFTGFLVRWLGRSLATAVASATGIALISAIALYLSLVALVDAAGGLG